MINLFTLIIFLSIIQLSNLNLAYASSAIANSSKSNQIVKEILDKAKQEKWHENPYWLKLLRYQKDGKEKSLADGENFFLSPKGKYSPLNELQANIKFLWKVGIYQSDKEYYCRFPARYVFLEQMKKNGYFDLNESTDLDLDLDFIKECSNLDVFFGKLKAADLTLEFSSYYLSRPASAFGHTFLRIKKKSIGEKYQSEDDQLLDYAVNYAGQIDTTNPIAYSYRGLLGKFRGNFHVMPYYYKVREYNDYEARDIYSYQIKTNQAQRDFLVLHLWELHQTYFDYFYLDENCSFHIMSFLDVVLHKINWENNHKFLFVAPIDTVKLLKKKNLILNKNFRPSSRLKMHHSFKKLTFEEKEVFHQYENFEVFQMELNPLEPNQKIKILDSAIDYFDKVYASDLLRDDPLTTSRKNKLLLLRSKIPLPSKITSDEFVGYDASPEESHGSSRLNFSLGTNPISHSYVGFGFRTALTDLMDPVKGMPPYTDLDMPSFEFRTFNNDRGETAYHLEHFNLINARVFNPVNAIEANTSYAFKFGFEKNYYYPKFLDSIYFLTKGHFGLSYEWSSILFYTMMGLRNLTLGETSVRTNVWQVNPYLGFYFEQNKFKLNWEWEYQENIFNQDFYFQHIFHTQLFLDISQNVSFGVQSRAASGFQEIQLSTRYFY